jgi:hypothetical protein
MLDRGPHCTAVQTSRRQAGGQGDVRDELQKPIADGPETVGEHKKDVGRVPFRDRRSPRRGGICAAWE